MPSGTLLPEHGRKVRDTVAIISPKSESIGQLVESFYVVHVGLLQRGGIRIAHDGLWIRSAKLQRFAACGQVCCSLDEPVEGVDRKLVPQTQDMPELVQEVIMHDGSSLGQGDGQNSQICGRLLVRKEALHVNRLISALLVKQAEMSLRFVVGGFEFDPQADAIPFIRSLLQFERSILRVIAGVESALDGVPAHLQRLLLDTDSGVHWPKANNLVADMRARAGLLCRRLTRGRVSIELCAACAIHPWRTSCALCCFGCHDLVARYLYLKILLDVEIDGGILGNCLKQERRRGALNGLFMSTSRRPTWP